MADKINMDRTILLKKVDVGVDQVGTVIRSMPWGSKPFYAKWCAQTFKYVSHSAPLIKLCAERLPAGPTKDDMNHHHREEVGHEKYAARDAEALGIDAKADPELPETTAIYGDIYDQIKANPAAMFGYAMALENVSKHYGPWIAAEVCKHYGITPVKHHSKNVPASFLTLHADVDQVHADEGIAALERIAEKDLPVVAEVMDKTFAAYANFLKAIDKSCSKRAA